MVRPAPETRSPPPVDRSVQQQTDYISGRLSTGGLLWPQSIATCMNSSYSSGALEGSAARVNSERPSVRKRVHRVPRSFRGHPIKKEAADEALFRARRLLARAAHRSARGCARVRSRTGRSPGEADEVRR